MPQKKQKQEKIKIAIVSDSHGSVDRLDKLLTTLEKEKVMQLIHAGDFAVYGVEEVFNKHPHVHIHIALGNADVNREIIDLIQKIDHVHLSMVPRLEIAGIVFGVSHVYGVAQADMNYQAHIFIHGHTHRREVRVDDGKLYINPGSLGDDGSYMMLTLPGFKLEHKYID